MLANSDPRIRCIPTDVVSSSGDDAIALARTTGLEPDPWQQLVVRDALSERADGKWSAFEVGLVTPRQNGKNTVLEIRELAGLFLFNEELILHSAHEFNTSDEHFLRIKYLINQSPDMTYRVNKILNGHGAQSIELLPSETIIMESDVKFVKYGKSSRIKFVARTGGSGRGFTGDVVVLDEAYRLPRRVISALMPTLSARKNPQVWYTSSAVDREEHEHGEMLTRVRYRGRKHSSPRLYYVEWSADEDKYNLLARQAERSNLSWRVAAGNKDLLRQSNPAIGGRIPYDVVEAELEAMPEKSFKVERLAIGDWPPLEEDQDDGVIKKSLWLSLRDDSYQHGPYLVFAAETSIDRKWSSIVAYSEDELGCGHIELVKRASGTSWVVPWLKERKEKWAPMAIGVDNKGPAASLILDLERAGLKRPVDPKKPRPGDLIVLTLSDMATGVGQFLDAVTQEQIKYLESFDLNKAVQGASLRKVGDLSVWGRRDSTVDVSPLTAATVARWVYRTHEEVLKNTNTDPMFAWV